MALELDDKNRIKSSELGNPLIVSLKDTSKDIIVTLMEYGLRFLDIIVPDKNSNLLPILLAYADPIQYKTDPLSIGAGAAGRVNGIIVGGQYKGPDGKIYQLEKNHGLEGKINTIHGGPEGFDKKLFKYQDYSREDTRITAKFSLTSSDGDQGFPGKLNLDVFVSLSIYKKLEIKYVATADKLTPIDISPNLHFNLDGANTNIPITKNHFMESDANHYAETIKLPQ